MHEQHAPHASLQAPMSHDLAAGILDIYYERFNRGDLEAVASMFDLPAMLIAGERRLILNSHDQVIGMYENLRSKFAGEAVVDVAWNRSSLALLHVHDYLVIARVAVTRFGKARALIRTWNSSYMLRRSADAWRFNLITSDEPPKARPS